MSRSTTVEPSSSGQQAFQLLASLLDTLDRPLVVADRRGRVLFTNLHAQDFLKTMGLTSPEPNLFPEILQADHNDILGQLEGGEQEISLPIETPIGKSRARLRWLPEPDWLVVYIEPLPSGAPSDESEMRQTVQDLMQEREITYRNLLAAYLRLQEVNRQKTVFLASAAHELKTPLAVMKGYYDLLLSGSLGKMEERQREILQESKESCDRLVRLVSMFLNYSALESGKLVLQLRENDIKDCVNDLTCRWQDPFKRANCEVGCARTTGFAALPVRLSESAAMHGQPAGQCLEAHPGRRHGHAIGSRALLGAPHQPSARRKRTPPGKQAGSECGAGFDFG